MTRARAISAAFIFIVSILSSLFSTLSYAASSDIENGARPSEQGLPLDQLRNFSDIFARIKSD